MAKWKTRIDGSPAQVGQRYPERSSAYPYGARRRASGTVMVPVERSVESFKKPGVSPERAEKERLDAIHVKSLQAKGFTVIDGGQKTVKGLDSIHAVKGIRHLGFGYFEDANYTYDRADNPKTGTRFYIRKSKHEELTHGLESPRSGWKSEADPEFKDEIAVWRKRHDFVAIHRVQRGAPAWSEKKITDPEGDRHEGKIQVEINTGKIMKTRYFSDVTAARKFAGKFMKENPGKENNPASPKMSKNYLMQKPFIQWTKNDVKGYSDAELSKMAQQQIKRKMRAAEKPGSVKKPISMRKAISEKDQSLLETYRGIYQPAESKTIKKGDVVYWRTSKYRGQKAGTVIDVRAGGTALLLSTRGVGKRPVMRTIGKRHLVYAIQGDDGRIHFGASKDVTKKGNPGLSGQPQKTMFFPAKGKYAEIVSLKSPNHARLSTARLEREYEKARTKEKRTRILKVTTLATNRARASGKRKHLSSRERAEFRKIAQLYEESKERMKRMGNPGSDARLSSQKAKTHVTYHQRTGTPTIHFSQPVTRPGVKDARAYIMVRKEGGGTERLYLDTKRAGREIQGITQLRKEAAQIKSKQLRNNPGSGNPIKIAELPSVKRKRFIKTLREKGLYKKRLTGDPWIVDPKTGKKIATMHQQPYSAWYNLFLKKEPSQRDIQILNQVKGIHDNKQMDMEAQMYVYSEYETEKGTGFKRMMAE